MKPRPEAIIGEALAEYGEPRKRFVLFSGGNDSTVLAHWAKHNTPVDALVHIDTGTALPGVREHCERVAELLDMELLVYESRDTYEKLVLGELNGWSGGFPGPAAHYIAYNRLKDRRIWDILRDHKEQRTDRIMLLSGVRQSESARRMRTAGFHSRYRAQIWVNPLYFWSSDDMRAYRRAHDLPQSDVAAIMHRSGECNCGCFAAPGERDMIRAFYPEFDAWLCDLERRVAERGIAACKWGVKPPRPGAAAAGPMCSDCQLTLEGVE